MRHARRLPLALLASLALTASAHADPKATLHVSLSPDQLGRATTIAFAVHVLAGPGERLPPALTDVDLRYPQSIGIAVSGLGLATCTEATLETIGPTGCPAEARVGYGSALTAFPIGPETIYETATAVILRAPEPGEHIAMYFNVEGDTPLIAQLLLPGLLAPTNSPNYESIDISVPLVEGVAGGSDVSVTRLNATLGPKSLTYYEHTSHGYLPYKPRGILLPNHCPHHGFQFTVTLTFATGQTATAGTTVTCR